MTPLFQEKSPSLFKKTPLTIGLCSLLFTLIAAIIVLASVPPTDRDALTHHLFVPKLWLQHGSIYEIPEIPFSYYPMNLDLLYSIPLYFGNDIIPKYIHFSFALLTGLLLYQYLNTHLGKVYGLFGTLFFLSVPNIVKLSITTYVDLGLAFFTTASLLLLLHWANRHFRWRFLVFAGLCCGLAAGTKYNGIVAIVVLALLVPLLYQQNATVQSKNSGKALICGVIFTISALTAFSPWLLRNYLWTNNPIYPLHNSLFQKQTLSNEHQQKTNTTNLTDTLNQISPQGNNAFIGRKILYNESWWQALLLPIRFFYEGRDDDPRYFDGKLTPFLLVLPALAFLIRPVKGKQRKEDGFLLWFTLLYFFFTFFQEAMRIRYIIPIVPALVILSMHGIHNLLEAIKGQIQSSTRRKSVIILASLCISLPLLGYNGQYIAELFTIVKPLSFVLGEVSRDEYIKTFRPEYSAIKWLNTRTSPQERLLCLFLGNRGYYMNFLPVFYNPYNAQQSLDHVTAKYVLVRDDLFQNWIGGLTRKGTPIRLPFQPSAPLYSADGYSVYLRSSQIDQPQS